MPPALFTRSAHHSVPRSPAVPTGAAMPARIATIPIFTSGACARASSGKPPMFAAALLATTPFRNVRLLVIEPPLDMGAAQPQDPQTPSRPGGRAAQDPQPPPAVLRLAGQFRAHQLRACHQPLQLLRRHPARHGDEPAVGNRGALLGR